MLSSTKSRKVGKTLIQSFFFILLVTRICYGQWYWQNPLPTNNALYSVDFIDENIGWCVGEFGTIIKTENGGENWITQASRISNHLKSVRFYNANIGCAVGENGVILRTIDGGITWMSQSSGTNENLNSVCEIDINSELVVGNNGTILKTTNGGENWDPQQSGTNKNLKSIYFVDNSIGWAVGDSTILKTTNGGTNWLNQPAGSGYLLSSVCFVNTNTGWAVGNTIIKTTDGGENWIQLANYPGGWSVSCSFVDENTGLVLQFLDAGSWGNYINVIKTTDGGNTWNEVFAESFCGTGAEVCLLDENVAFILSGGRLGGLYSLYHPIIIKTKDGGDNWVYLTRGCRRNLVSVHFINENVGWVAGNNPGGFSVYWPFFTILKTTNAGLTWVTQIDSSFEFDVDDIFFIDSLKGWAVGLHHAIGNAILKTNDGGYSWILQSYAGGNSVYFVDSNNGWIIGSEILRTSDGGNNWFSQSNIGGNCIYFVDKNIGWIVGEAGAIYKTINGGTDWTIQQSGTTNNLFSIHFSDFNNGCAVGENGSILYTSNGGESWISQLSGMTMDFYSVHLSNQSVGWTTGMTKGEGNDYGNGKVLYTKDGGISWTTQVTTTHPLNSMTFVNQNIGWVVGFDGTIIHTTNGGVSFVEEEQMNEIPTEFLLSQNYPNPFNPSTKIKYSVPQTSNVIVKVFDILGNEIEILVSEEKPAGTYEITWNAANLPSGIYFYRLQAGSFVETKKMLLLK
jgi:photosystem II stability/assembly factor-like uncharacterized protein